MGCFHDQIMPRAIRREGHPWLQRPSGSTMQPSVQQAGEVPSNIAWRAYSKAPSSEGSQPSFSSASMALIRYGLRVAVETCVVFIILNGRKLPVEPTLAHGLTGEFKRSKRPYPRNGGHRSRGAGYGRIRVRPEPRRIAGNRRKGSRCVHWRKATRRR